MTGINLHTYPSNFTHESRMLRETGSIGKLGVFDRIVIAAIWEPGLEEHQRLDEKREVWRVRLRSSALPGLGFLKMVKRAEWTLRVVSGFRREPVAMVNCHSLSSLMVGALLKTATGAVLVYDTHELETERNGWSWGRRMLGKALERAMIGRVDLVITVNESIAEWYKKAYSLRNVHAVYNFPQGSPEQGSSDSCDLKKRFNIRSDELTFIYQGILGRGRYIGLLLQVFSNVGGDKHVVFMGYGPFEGEVRQFSDRFSNIHFQPAAKPEDVVRYVRSVDVGLHLFENTSLSGYFTLGNKFAECIAAGLPVVTVDFPEPARIVDAYDCGWKVRADENAISDLIRRLSVDEVRHKKNGVLKCQDALRWENEEAKMFKAYEGVFGPRAGNARGL